MKFSIIFAAMAYLTAVSAAANPIDRRWDTKTITASCTPKPAVTITKPAVTITKPAVTITKPAVTITNTVTSTDYNTVTSTQYNTVTVTVTQSAPTQAPVTPPANPPTCWSSVDCILYGNGCWCNKNWWSFTGTCSGGPW